MTPNELDNIIKSLSNPARRDILSWLKTPHLEFQGQSSCQFGVCVGKIFEKSGLSQSTVSSHLANLQRAGLVSSTRQGQWVYYQRNEAVIEEFAELLKKTL
ncbi:ArsR/SmtB family transcription factor [Marinomonas spartinae]|uniref:ArsR/SmtB family transcription factor n=1 Tax=Marinomonas spartinae TaxID=1792290 RepID=UPI0018F13032|nr:helix-turn-helix transcriptional regulator [Marinomonas spartinae]MBJ7554703.1 helix-turn-helix transcriptional regulator [Marinomonas spartinae]